MFTDDSFSEDTVLRDGRPVHLRWIRPTDDVLLREAFERLSPESRHARFFTPLPRLSDELVHYLTHVDGVDHCAVVAVTNNQYGIAQRGLGVARFVRSREDPTLAEVAITVADDVQGLGLAPILLSKLAGAARARGIVAFTATVLPGNGRVRGLLRKLGVKWDPDEGRIALGDSPTGPRPLADLRRPRDLPHPPALVVGNGL